jgi:putative transcriptional regulator
MDTESLAGHFLVASPSILDPHFHRAVVFVTAHSEEGAVGLILNRRSESTVGDAVPQLAPVTDLTDPVYVGGPVNPEGVAVLAEFHDPDEAGVVVIEDIGFVALDDALEEGAPELERTRVFAGVAGWGPDQLEDELERDDWIIVEACPDDVFDEDATTLWSRVLDRQGGHLRLVARMPLDPSTN